MPQLGVELGRLFEVGFNIGVLTYIQQHNMQNRFGNLYQEELRKLKLPKIMQKFYKEFNVIDEVDRKIIEQWVIDIIQRGFLGGYNFFREYLASPKKVEILYYQCLFSGQNSLGTYPKEENKALREILARQQLPHDAGVIDRYTAKGHFLKADLLCWMVSRRQQHHILAVDLSIFSVREMYDLADLNSVEVLRGLLARELNYIRSKSNFAALSIDTRSQELPISPQFERYFKAFSREDKESSKLIQAAGYAHSFYTFLKEHHLLDNQDNHPNRSVYFNVIGYTDRGMSAMAVGEEQSELLATCGKIYQKKDDDSPLAQEKARNELKEARKKVIELIKSQAARSLTEGKAFFNQMLNYDYRASSGVTPFNLSESLTNFVNTADNIPADYAERLNIKAEQSLRDAHAELITRALNSSASYIFLTGNPGIGKTTAITKFLQEHMADGFLFLYVSPRTQVNLDIIEKFRVEEENREGLSRGTREWRPFIDDRLFLLNTNLLLIQRHSGQRDGQMSYTVGYYTNTRQGHFDQSSVRFIDASTLDESTAVRRAKAVESVDETTFTPTKTTLPGVLASLCQGLYVAIHDQLSSNLVAAISIQSLKKTSHDKDTLSLHFKKIFGDVYDDRAKAVRPSKMQAMSKRIKHIFVMIDEITGDEGGVAFLDGIRKELKELELFDPKHGFNTKIIVADASIVDRDVIEQHLSSTEPERDKIFFRQAANATAPIPLSYDEFTFRRRSAVIINANSYPASTLHLNYKVFIEALQYSEESLLAKEHLASTTQEHVVADILQLMRQPESDQLIVYMQDKLRLARMIELIGKERKAKGEGTFEEMVDYVQIHAELLDNQKKALENCKAHVKVVFMTSSASRGLSFPKARHLLIVVPRFAIEQNLMEIIQVIYRGRGKEMDKKEKYLTFYLAERAIYDPKDEDYQLAIKERVLNLINLLLILKSSIMTRIRGYGVVGRKQYAIVPVGGKSVAAAGDTFSSKMSDLMKALRKEQQKRPYDVALGDIRKKLETLLRDSDFDLYKKIAKSEERLPQNYLNLLESFEGKVVNSLYTGFDKLLEVGPLQKGYISGNLLIIPLAEHRVEESIEMQLWNQIMPVLDDHLERQMYAIAKNKEEYPDTLRSLMQDAVDLISELKDKTPDKSQRLEQSSSWDDLYLAIPLFTMVSREAFKTYFAKKPIEPEDNSFRDLLKAYVYSLYPADSFLPIGSSYGKFPFVIFRSYNLGEIRQKPFIDRYLLTSTELNVLNLILSN